MYYIYMHEETDDADTLVDTPLDDADTLVDTPLDDADTLVDTPLEDINNDADMPIDASLDTSDDTILETATKLSGLYKQNVEQQSYNKPHKQMLQTIREMLDEIRMERELDDADTFIQEAKEEEQEEEYDEDKIPIIAGSFINKTSDTKFHGTFILDNETYEYIFYLTSPKKLLPKKQRIEIIEHFGNRKHLGKPCLGIDKSVISKYLDGKSISAYVMVKTINTDNIASGTLQIYDLCDAANTSQDVWINDVCRSSPSGNNRGNPLKAMLSIMEQLVVQNLGNTAIKLYIYPYKESIERKYESLGFTHSDDLCPNWKDEYIMVKTGLQPNYSIIDLSILRVSRATRKRKREGGKKKKGGKTQKIIRNKTHKNGKKQKKATVRRLYKK